MLQNDALVFQSSSEIIGGTSQADVHNDICTECLKVFSQYSLLLEHVRVAHSEKYNLMFPAQKPSSKDKQICGVCNKTFSNVSNLRVHEQKYHAIENQRKKNHKCPLCGSTSGKKAFLSHFESTHGIKIETETKEFSSIKEYETWKSSLEMETFSRFVKGRGTIKNKYFHEHYFQCHRSGYYISEGKGIRKLKTKGSNKIDGICPAGLEVFEGKNGKCSVLYRKTHVGHKNDVSHLPLTASERQYVADKINQNQPFNVILNEVRSCPPDSGVQRVNLLTKKDLYNIERKTRSVQDKPKNINPIIENNNDNFIDDEINSLTCDSNGELSEIQYFLKNNDILTTHNNLYNDDEMIEVCQNEKTDADHEQFIDYLLLEHDNAEAQALSMDLNKTDGTYSFFERKEYIKRKFCDIIECLTNSTKLDEIENFLNAFENINLQSDLSIHLQSDSDLQQQLDSVEMNPDQLLSDDLDDATEVLISQPEIQNMVQQNIINPPYELSNKKTQPFLIPETNDILQSETFEFIDRMLDLQDLKDD